jgi:uncharacterized protein
MKPGSCGGVFLSIDVRDLLGSPGEQREVELVVQSPPVEADGGAVIFEPARVRLVLTSTPGGILGWASVDSKAEVACSRCLSRFSESLQGDLEHMFVTQKPQQPQGPPRGAHGRGKMPIEVDDEIEAGEDEAETSPIIDGHIDVRPLVAEMLSLSLSMKPLCRQDCRGLCPVCGCNLNETKCLCGGEDIDPRLAGLAGLVAPVTGAAGGEPAGKSKEKDQRGRTKT